MNITSLTTRVIAYDAQSKQLAISVKSNLCQRQITDYRPILVDMAQTDPPYDIAAACKQAASSAYHMIKARLVTESKTPEFFQDLAEQMQGMIDSEQNFVLGVDIPSPDTALVNESSSEDDSDAPVQTV